MKDLKFKSKSDTSLGTEGNISNNKYICYQCFLSRMGITWIVELIKFVRNGRNFFSAYSLRLIMNECSDYNFPRTKVLK